ncbi:hypothetical protein SAMN06265365_12729 [Tistlia consotensis]|uniref:Methyl-accepting chemotaxis protein n=1 Tax=Tistlia consotensis USBA 355 TaxID=560819 RepID=A0A1Y6CL66_9PROT|nr:hypothetical protein [Tistlia consotensis]SMF70567.1 hypothetical protein SAMN05428998_12951 [Tistlia consotensis USBA 355]SNS04764.1 hypothetical protein SAMN06265365_12729 [Tistlia consotensis]
MHSQAAFALPYPPQVGSRLVVALARALNGRPAGPEASEALPLGRPDRADPAETRQVALALRDTCRVVAGELAARPAPRRAAPLAERLTATASQIGEVLALFDRTTEQMHRLAADALAAAPGGGPIEDGLTVVASEVGALSLQTRQAQLRVARQVEALHGAAAGPAPGGKAGAAARAAVEMDWSAPGKAAVPPQRSTTRRPEGEFSLLAWLARDAETPDQLAAGDL